MLLSCTYVGLYLMNNHISILLTCHAFLVFDIISGSPARFFFLKSQCHANAGLSCTYVGLYLMKSGQPALLYLVPSTLGTRAAEILIPFYTILVGNISEFL